MGFFLRKRILTGRLFAAAFLAAVFVAAAPLFHSEAFAAERADEIREPAAWERILTFDVDRTALDGAVREFLELTELPRDGRAGQPEEAEILKSYDRVLELLMKTEDMESVLSALYLQDTADDRTREAYYAVQDANDSAETVLAARLVKLSAEPSYAFLTERYSRGFRRAASNALKKQAGQAERDVSSGDGAGAGAGSSGQTGTASAGAAEQGTAAGQASEAEPASAASGESTLTSGRQAIRALQEEYGAMPETNEAFDSIDRYAALYLRYVKELDRAAQAAGYADYAAMAADAEGMRTDSEAQEFRDAMVEEIVPLKAEIEKRLAVMHSRVMSRTLSGEDPAEVFSVAEPLVGAVHPDLTPAFTDLTEKRLYLLKRTKSSRRAYMDPLFTERGGLVYAELTGNTAADVRTAVHEFGHFYAEYRAEEDPLRTLYSALDLGFAETQADGLLALTAGAADAAFSPEDAELWRLTVLADLMNGVIAGCCIDELERTVLRDPDMSSEEFLELKRSLRASYGSIEGVPDYFYWPHHMFERPLYYIHYAYADLAALELWAESCTDREGAVRKYMVLAELPYGCTYGAAMKAAGLRGGMDAASVRAVAAEVRQALAADDVRREAVLDAVWREQAEARTARLINLVLALSLAVFVPMLLLVSRAGGTRLSMWHRIFGPPRGVRAVRFAGKLRAERAAAARQEAAFHSRRRKAEILWAEPEETAEAATEAAAGETTDKTTNKTTS